MRLYIVAHAGTGDNDYAWDYGQRPGRHARLHHLLSAIEDVLDRPAPCQDEYCDGEVVWEIDDDAWAAFPPTLVDRIARCPDIRVVAPCERSLQAEPDLADTLGDMSRAMKGSPAARRLVRRELERP